MFVFSLFTSNITWGGTNRSTYYAPYFTHDASCIMLNIDWTPLKSSKVKVTRPINANTVNAQYLPNVKVYTNLKLGIQTEHENPHQQQAQ